jgi:cytidylate kinase
VTSAPQSAPVIAVDGPAASGKGTVAEGVAQALGFHLLDSGALYRLVAHKALAGIALTADAELARAATGLDAVFRDGSICPMGGVTAPSARRRWRRGLAGAVHPAAVAAARPAFVRQPPGLVADGRDMGTVVFPDAAQLFGRPALRSGRRRHS